MTSIRNLEGVSRSNAWAVNSPDRIQVMDGFNPRKQFNKIDELAEEIRGDGLLTPLWVRRDRANEEQPFILIAGERRIRALRKLFAENPEMDMRIPVIIYDVDEEEARDLAAKENLEREGFTLSEKVDLVREYQKRAFNNTEIGTKVGMSVSWVDQMTTMAGAMKAVKNAVDEGQISMEAGLIIARKAKAADQKAALDEVLKVAGGSKRKTAKAAAQVTGAARRPGKKDIVKLVQSLSQAVVNGDSVPTKDARKLVIMALNVACGEESGDTLLETCRKHLKLKEAASSEEQ